MIMRSNNKADSDIAPAHDADGTTQHPVPTAQDIPSPQGQPLTQDQMKDAAMASKLLMAGFGEIVSVLLRAKDYRNKRFRRWRRSPRQPR